MAFSTMAINVFAEQRIPLNDNGFSRLSNPSKTFDIVGLNGGDAYKLYIGGVLSGNSLLAGTVTTGR